MDKWLKDVLPDKNSYHKRGRDQMRKNVGGGGGSGIQVPVVHISNYGVYCIEDHNLPHTI